MAQTTYDAVMGMLIPALFFAVLYFFAGLQLTAGAFFSGLSATVLSIVAAQSLGLFISCSIMDTAMAFAVSAIMVLVLMLMGGFCESWKDARQREAFPCCAGGQATVLRSNRPSN